MTEGIDAVIFDWGGTLTRWHDIDFHAESLALAQAVVGADHDVEVSRERLHAAGDTVWGRSPRPPAERDGRRPLHRGRARARPRPADGVLRVLGAAHPHRPGGRAAVGGAARRGDQGRRALQHDLAARLARGLLPRATACTTSSTATSTPARSRGRSRRRTRSRAAMEAVGATDPAAACTSATGSSTTSGAPRTPACARSTSRTARSRRPRSATPRATPDAVVHRLSRDPGDRRRAGSDRSALRFCTFVQCRNVRNRSIALRRRRVACFCKSDTRQSPHIPADVARGPQVQASAVRVLTCSGEHLGSSPEGEYADRCLVQGPDRPAAHLVGRVRPPARRTSSRRTPRSPARRARSASARSSRPARRTPPRRRPGPRRRRRSRRSAGRAAARCASYAARDRGEQRPGPRTLRGARRRATP